MNVFQSYHMVLIFFSRIFLVEPERDFIESIVSHRLFDEWPFDSDEPLFAESISKMQDFYSHWDSEMLGALTNDFLRLFVGLESTLAPPYESVYLGEDHILFDRQTLEVRSFYQKYQLKVPRKNVEPDDHLGFQLHFCAILCGRIAENGKGRKSDTVETLMSDLEQFLKNHLLMWLDPFVERVYSYGKTDY